MSSRPVPQDRVERVFVVLASSTGCEPRISDKVRIDHRRERVPLLIGSDRDRDPFVVAVVARRCRVHAVRAEVVLSVRGPRRYLPGGLVVQPLGTEERDHSGELGQVDLLGLTRAISLAERSRELATLRVIGFRHREVAAILIGELLWLTAFAIPVGCLLGYGFAQWMTAGFDNEFYRFPAIINPSTFAMAGLIVLGATVVSSLSIFRKLGKLDLVTALKYKE